MAVAELESEDEALPSAVPVPAMESVAANAAATCSAGAELPVAAAACNLTLAVETEAGRPGAVVVAHTENSGSAAATTSADAPRPGAAGVADSFSNAADPNSCNSADGTAVADGIPDRNAMEPRATSGPVVVPVEPRNVERAELLIEGLLCGATIGRDYGVVPEQALPSSAPRRLWPHSPQ